MFVTLYVHCTLLCVFGLYVCDIVYTLYIAVCVAGMFVTLFMHCTLLCVCGRYVCDIVYALYIAVCVWPVCL